LSGVEVLFAEGGPLSRVKTGYSARPEQVRLAKAVAQTLSEKGVLLADAPTGTGKSLSHLAPAALAGKAVVSTATIQLQGQMLGDDLPPLRAAAASLLGYPEAEGFDYAVLKGRRNFVCDRRFDDTLRAGMVLDAGLLRRLDRWRAETPDGDREGLPFPVPTDLWVEVASDGEDCSPKTCPYREGCHYYAHREVAENSDLLVVNHALLLVNAVAKGAVFDTEGRHLVIDEAHRLEEVMSEAFGARVTYPRVRYVCRQARKKSEGATAPAERAEMAADLFFDALRTETTLGSEGTAPRGYRALVEALTGTAEALASDPKEEANDMVGMVARLLGDLRHFYAGLDTSRYAYAVAPGKRTKRDDPLRQPYPELRSWLLATGEAFREVVLPLFPDGGVVLSSATLATGSGAKRSFSYARRRLGLEAEEAGGRRVREFAGSEIFDYANRVLLYLPDDLPEPGSEGFAAASARRAEELVGLSRGRALVLLSTGRAVKDYRRLFRPDGYPVRFQDDDSARKLIEWLKATEGGVVVGTRGMWEGTDVPGSAVSCVIIDKVPFPPPDDPVIEALCEQAGRGWFKTVSLPKAQTAVRQGAGRLMRRADDRGVIALLDGRVGRKSWGAAIVSALPPAPSTGELPEVARFFGEGS
jgi:ATP-dependent DNA helicase DinG